MISNSGVRFLAFATPAACSAGLASPAEAGFAKAGAAASAAKAGSAGEGRSGKITQIKVRAP
jgi:hypothetical protein